MNSVVVLGAGMQGVAAAYDLAKFGSFDRVTLADLDIGRAIEGADRVNRLVGRELVDEARVDASEAACLASFLPDYDLAVGALPYKLHALVEQVALAVGCSVVDMGQDDDTATIIHGRDALANSKGVSIVTDAGLAPGLVNILALDLLDRYPGSTHVRTYCGGLPERPVGPLGYVLRFSMDSVIGEYSDETLALRNGEIVHAPSLEGFESIDFGGVGQLEAFTTSGGSGTTPYTLSGRVANFEYKTLRYPGHMAAMKLFRDCGFWSEELLPRIGMSPREAFSAVMEAELSDEEIQDIVLVRVETEGPYGLARIEMLERQDPQTGFTAMERLTGFSTSIIALAVATGEIGPGCYGCESAMAAARFREELAKRHIGVGDAVPA